uniref:Uncharacterized protein n=1 Tax=Megaselia scalaris TaxID=36166 RepID=T1GLQ9_MEGSC
MGPFDSGKLVSNYTKTLDMLPGLCDHLEMKSLRLDGSVPAADRNAISSNVEDLERWAKEDVRIYRLITCGTIEEKVFQRQIRKLSFGTVMKENCQYEVKFSNDDLEELFVVDPRNFLISSTHESMKCNESNEICRSGDWTHYQRPFSENFLKDTEIIEEGVFSCNLFTETQASISPFITQGNAFKGDISIFKSAMLAKVVEGVKGFPAKTETPNVNRHIKTGVVAQK